MIVGWVTVGRWPQAVGKGDCLGSQRWLVGHFLPGREELRQKIGNNEKDIAKEESMTENEGGTGQNWLFIFYTMSGFW